MPEPANHIRPELFPRVAGKTAEETERAAPHRLPGGADAGRQPRVFDHVVDGVAGNAAPGDIEMAIASLRQEDRFHRIASARPDAFAPRTDVARLLAP